MKDSSVDFNAIEQLYTTGGADTGSSSRFGLRFSGLKAVQACNAPLEIDSNDGFSFYCYWGNSGLRSISLLSRRSDVRSSMPARNSPQAE
jgi:hypothetical protein